MNKNVFSISLWVMSNIMIYFDWWRGVDEIKKNQCPNIGVETLYHFSAINRHSLKKTQFPLLTVMPVLDDITVVQCRHWMTSKRVNACIDRLHSGPMPAIRWLSSRSMQAFSEWLFSRLMQVSSDSNQCRYSFRLMIVNDNAHTYMKMHLVIFALHQR